MRQTHFIIPLTLKIKAIRWVYMSTSNYNRCKLNYFPLTQNIQIKKQTTTKHGLKRLTKPIHAYTNTNTHYHIILT